MPYSLNLPTRARHAILIPHDPGALLSQRALIDFEYQWEIQYRVFLARHTNPFGGKQS